MSAARDDLRAQMIDLISAHSEDVWCAGWMGGIDEEIRERGGLWLMMAATCGGWPKGYRADEGWVPLTAEERQQVLAIVEAAT